MKILGNQFYRRMCFGVYVCKIKKKRENMGFIRSMSQDKINEQPRPAEAVIF